MNAYLFEEISRSRRSSLIAEAAADRRADRRAARTETARRTNARGQQAGFWASVRRALMTPGDAEANLTPSLCGYPTAHR